MLRCAAPPLQARHAQIDTETALAALKRSAAQREVDLDAEDGEAVRQVQLRAGGGHVFAVVKAQAFQMGARQHEEREGQRCCGPLLPQWLKVW